MTQEKRKPIAWPTPEDFEPYEELRKIAELDEDEQTDYIIELFREVREEMWHENWRYDNEKQCWRYIGEKQAEPIKPLTAEPHHETPQNQLKLAT
ncbi:MAG: hypothetical protein FWG64_10290, partial [Firmicutes bacterium]|nr:hypothetical protein [Bacillota bacterium]